MRAAARSKGIVRRANTGSTLLSNQRRRYSPWVGSVRSLAITPRSIPAGVIAEMNSSEGSTRPDCARNAQSGHHVGAQYEGHSSGVQPISPRRWGSKSMS